MRKLLNFSAAIFASLMLMATVFVFNAYAQEATPTPEPTPVATEQPAQTPEPSSTPDPSSTPEPTVTPEPSSTPAPTSTPSPEPTPATTPEPSKAPTSTPEPSSTPNPSSQPSASPSSTPSPTATPTSTPAPTSVTTPSVSINTPYTFSNMKVVFTELPSSEGSITFTTKSLSSSLVDQLKALTSTVYEITSSMANGSFTYDLTLPLPAGVNGTDFKVFYASDVNGLNSPTQVSEQITNNGDGTFTIHGLNHFTVFVVVNPNSQANCDGITIGTTPGTTCFTTVQAAVNAAVDGDTINVGSTGSPYNETVYVNKILTINGVGNPSVTAFVLQKTPVTITGITTTVTIETPTVSLTNPVNSSNQTNASITGTGAANATVNYSISGSSGTPVTGTGLVSAGGVINITGINVTTLPDGPLTLTVSLSSGSYSSSNATAASFKDTVGPAQASGLTITNPINIGNQTNVSISGNAEAGATVNWTISNGAPNITGTTTVNGSGAFSVTGIDVSSLADGTLTLSVTVRDAASNNSPAATTTATKDVVAPTVNAGSNTSRNAAFTTSASASDPAPSSGLSTFSWSQQSGPGTITFGTPNALNTTVSANTDGTYVVRLTATDGAGNSTSSQFTLVWDTVAPTVSGLTNATTNTTVTRTATVADPAPSSGIATTVWSQQSGPGTITFGTPNAVSTTISADTDGTYTVRFTATDNAGNSSSQDITFVWDVTPPTVSTTSPVYENNGANVTATASDSLSGIATVSWSQISGPGTVNFNPNNALTTLMVANQDGTYVVRVTVTDNAGNSAFSNMTLIWDSVPPQASAGSTINTNTSVTLTNSPSDPAPSSGIAATDWLQVAGPAGGVLNFTTPNSTSTNVNANIDGTYTINFRVTDNAGNMGFAGYTFVWDTTAPTVSAGTTPQNRNAIFTQVGSASDSLSGLASVTWSTISGPGTVSFGTPNATTTTVSTNQDGVYVIQLSATDNAGNTANSQFTLNWDTASPTVNAGADATTNAGFTQTGTSTDPAPSSGGLVYAWSQTSGPGTITFGSSSALVTTVSASADGTYVIRLTVTDAAGNSNFDEFQLVWDTVAPTVSAGADQVRNALFTQTGTVTDPIPSSGGLVYLWSQVSGPGTITFGTDNTVSTTISASVDGDYVVRLTATDAAGNSTNSTFNLTWDTVVPTVNAGPNVLRNASFTTTATATDTAPSSGIASYLWSQVSGPGTITFGTPATLNTTVSADTDGVYVIRLTVTDNAGNTNNSTFTLTWDTTAPTLSAITVTSSNANPNFARVGDTITLSFTSSETIQTPTVTIAGQTVTATNPSANNWTASYVMTASDTEGLIPYTIAYDDTAGNSGTPVSANSTITFDRTNPTADFTAPSANSTVSGNVTLTASASDTNGVVSVVFEYRRNDGVSTFQTIATDTTSPYSTTWDTNALALDTYTLRITVTDSVGNVTQVSQNVDVATVINSASVITNSATHNSVVITWTTDDQTSSRVIYDTISHPTLASPPNYGYADSTQTFDTTPKVTNHSVSLTNLKPSTTYYYRVVSAGSPEAVSDEFSFSTEAFTSAGAGGASGPSAPGAPGCDSAKPGGTPTLLSAIAKGNKILLKWSKAKDPVTYYLIKYGLGHDSYQFGVPNVGNVTEFEIGGLQSGVTYYFRVRAGNGCNAAGEFSNELKVVAGTTFAHEIIEVTSRALGVREAFAAEEELALSEEESTKSAESSTPSAQPSATPTESPKTEVKTPNNQIKDILVTAGLVILVTAGALYYTTLKKKA